MREIIEFIMRKYFFICDEIGVSKFFESELERDKRLLEFIDEYCLEEGIYDADIIKDIKIGIITHKLEYVVLDKLEDYEDPDEWAYRRSIHEVGDYKLKLLTPPS
jgi:hypothetical protein